MRFNELSLFTGYGGFSLGLRLAGLEVRTVGYCEIEKYCQEIIKARIKDGYLDDAPIFPDIRAFDGRQYRGMVDIVTGGFPCQPHSVAGKRRAAADERNLWPDTLRVISEVGPAVAILENVPGLIYDGYGATVIGQLSEAGFDCKWLIVSAQEAGAPHKRDRWWCLAYSKSERCREAREYLQRSTPRASGRRKAMGNTEYHGLFAATLPRGDEATIQSSKERLDCPGEPEGTSRPRLVAREVMANSKLIDGQRSRQDGKPFYSAENQVREASGFADGSWWKVEPGLGRMADGSPYWMDRIKAIGNGIVPGVVPVFLSRVNFSEQN